ncbi:MAG TPA: ester cyclase [Flavisolibacter sp.]|jgi:predicted ester cyclase|nr:ester cyclase [Flavisolibacter sp.]
MTNKNKQTVERFIQEVWNNRNFDVLDEVLHPDYQDHSFLPSVPPTKEGLKFWIQNTSDAFDHKTHIESIVSEGNHVAIRIRFSVTHIGTWRGVAPTGRQANIKGFRFFTLKDGKLRNAVCTYRW